MARSVALPCCRWLGHRRRDVQAGRALGLAGGKGGGARPLRWCWKLKMTATALRRG